MVVASNRADATAIGVPYVPPTDDTVLQRVATSNDPRVRHFEQLRARLRQQPRNRELALKLSRAYISYGRSTGDARYLGRALAPLRPWLKLKKEPADVMIVHATILQSRHLFDAARVELKRALARAPGSAQGWLTLATVDMVQGHDRAARIDCAHTANSGGQFLAIVCNGALLSLTGRAQQAYRLLSLIEGGGQTVPAGVKSFVEGLLAAAAGRMGRPKLADAHYRRALQYAPGDNFLLANYGDALLDQGRPKAVIALVQDYTASDTSLMRLVLAEAAIKSPKTQADIDTMAVRFKAMERRGSHVYRREQVRFALYLQHDPRRALALAQKNWTVQRAPKDVRGFLEAALAAHRPRAAAPVIAFLARTHMSDPHIDPLAARVRAALSPRRGPATAPQ